MGGPGRGVRGHNTVMHGVLGIRRRNPVQSLGSGPTCPILALLGDGPPRGNGKRYVTLLKRNSSLQEGDIPFTVAPGGVPQKSQNGTSRAAAQGLHGIPQQSRDRRALQCYCTAAFVFLFPLRFLCLSFSPSISR